MMHVPLRYNHQNTQQHKVDRVEHMDPKMVFKQGFTLWRIESKGVFGHFLIQIGIMTPQTGSYTILLGPNDVWHGLRPVTFATHHRGENDEDHEIMNLL